MSAFSVSPWRLRCGIVLAVAEDACDILGQGQLTSVEYATVFPSPRTERVSPGHRAEDADVELDEVERFYTERGLWNRLL